MTKYSDLISGGSFQRCYHSHPPLSIGEFRIYGGSCSTPIILDADIYVGFDYNMKTGSQGYPWTPGHSFLFHIPDGYPPPDTHQAKQLVDWLAMNLSANQKIHLGCIGGHGRTGTILAALVYTLTGERDAIEYVRKHYCTKAVESQSQIEWLHTVYGITKAPPSKGLPKSGRGTNMGSYTRTSYTGSSSRKKSSYPVDEFGLPLITPAKPKRTDAVIEPTRSASSIWGSNAI